MPTIYLILSLIFLYLTKSWLTKKISRLVHQVGGDRNITIWFWSVFFLPGTVIHEISHFLVAAGTGARTGKIEIMPEFIEEDEDGGGVALGSVQTQKLNPIQGFLVGVAPFVTGLILLMWLSKLIPNSFQTQNYYLLAGQVYLFFVIANSFFPSWSDIRQTLPLIAISVSTLVTLWIVGIGFSFQSSATINNLFLNFSQVIFLCSLLNLIVFGFLSLINRLIILANSVSS